MKIFLLAVACCFILIGCGSGTETDTGKNEEIGGLSGKVRLDGSSTVFPISEAVAEEFSTIEPRIRVTVGVSGTGGGFKKFLAGETDINDASRSIKPSEQEKAVAAGIDYIEIPVAYDGLSVIVNLKNDWVDYLTVAELNAIWQPGSTVKTWADVREGWPAKEIRLYGPGTDSGTFDYFTKAINGEEQASRADFTASEDDNVLVQGISGDRYSLGYFGFAYYVENRDKLKIVPIDGAGGAIAPSIETINNGTYAPLSRPIFIYVNPASLDDPAVARFVEFYIEQAGALSQEVGYVALPESVYTGVRQRIANRTSGTAYGENPTVKKLTGR
ncbi:MAG: PstS family phosphate ABC transporter substrate-binding protein [Gammaproteobacteria bacterium]|nr:PstS family phosphate ABC transporter substrate-binding protein [Gammaproteobacteria bacterium]MBT4493208.1 PstS family phosphate ABC transporter substrate-binding protein [Gammaproteobacteria bacterium]MBT7369105.1 PstS family phosphate ABC transporter substrate-binding protein [Gammaproteobacteria bacterium]